ncbi:hypothetical protein KAT92_05830, partial [Candidatus Babeliales bacterium]|nr:hypothetical protein [Candidatus Babeliales bacterium]
VNAPDHPARNVNIENESVTVSTEYTNPVDVGGENLVAIGDALGKILTQMELQTEILKEIGK